MSKLISALFLAVGVALIMSPVAAQENVPAKKTAAKKKKTAKKEDQAASDKEDEKVDTTGHASTNYNCELGHKITLFQKANDDQQVTVRWRDRMHTLYRVSTTTGAIRYEGPKSGLVWIGIPSKGMLLDGQKGQPLANECKDPIQILKSAT